MGKSQLLGFTLAIAANDRRENYGIHYLLSIANVQLWNSLPPVYRQCAVAYTDFWAAYETVFPKKRHQAVGKAKQRGLGGLPHERLFQE